MSHHSERPEWEKTCYCRLCKKRFHPLGIMMHRAGHVNRGESGEIEYTHGNVVAFGSGNLDRFNERRGEKA